VLQARKGILVEGFTQRIAFLVSEAEAGIDVILLSDQASSIDLRLQTPSGRILEPWRALAEPTMRFVHGQYCSYFRLVLPTELLPGRFDREGTWHVLVKLGKLQLARSNDAEPGTDRSILHGLNAAPRQVKDRAAGALLDERVRRLEVAQRAAAGEPAAVQPAALRRRVSYAVRVHAYSSLSLQAELEQSSHEPGSNVRVSASLTEAGLPVQSEVTVTAELTDPRGVKTTQRLDPLGGGNFALEIAAAASGVHALRVEARGRTRRGQPFVRERELSAVVWRGADRELAPNSGDLQELLLSGHAGEEELLASGVDPERARKVRRVAQEG
jgi:hypothetical protein